MIGPHLPVLQVVIPLMAAPVCVLVHNPRLAWMVTALISWVSFFVACALLGQVADSGVISYALGSWAAPWGIEYRVDQTNAFVLLIVSAASAVIVMFARVSVEREVASDRIYLFYTVWCLNLPGCWGLPSPVTLSICLSFWRSRHSRRMRWSL